VRAVNLIPPDERRGGAGAPGRSGGAVYVVLGVLAVLVLATAAYVLAGNQINDRRSGIARAEADKRVAQQQAAALRPYRSFAQLRQTRIQTISSLAASRFDWDRVLRQLGQVLPASVWLTSFTGTVAPGVSFSGNAAGSGSTGQIRSKLPVPAVELVGCTTDQAEVSRVMTRLRLMQDVTRVSLSASEKVESAAPASGGSAGSGAGTSGGGSGDCRHGNSRFPRFEIVVFFKPLPGGAAPSQPGAPAGAAPPAASGSPAPNQAASNRSGTTGATP
jgi:Tfp pilus assembly protein PilN